MMVVDASAMVEVLLQSRRGETIAARLSTIADLSAPHLLDIEVAHAMRSYVGNKTLDRVRGDEALRLYRTFIIERYSHELLLDRIWKLRDNLTAYDAAYVALAEMFDAPLITCDAKLARAPGHAATIELIR